MAAAVPPLGLAVRPAALAADLPVASEADPTAWGMVDLLAASVADLPVASEADPLAA